MSFLLRRRLALIEWFQVLAAHGITLRVFKIAAQWFQTLLHIRLIWGAFKSPEAKVSPQTMTFSLEVALVIVACPSSLAPKIEIKRGS